MMKLITIAINFILQINLGNGTWHTGTWSDQNPAPFPKGNHKWCPWRSILQEPYFKKRKWINNNKIILVRSFKSEIPSFSVRTYHVKTWLHVRNQRHNILVSCLTVQHRYQIEREDGGIRKLADGWEFLQLPINGRIRNEVKKFVNN